VEKSSHGKFKSRIELAEHTKSVLAAKRKNKKAKKQNKQETVMKVVDKVSNQGGS